MVWVLGDKTGRRGKRVPFRITRQDDLAVIVRMCVPNHTLLSEADGGCRQGCEPLTGSHSDSQPLPGTLSPVQPAPGELGGPSTEGDSAHPEI